MSEQPRVLAELGEELRRAAQRELGAHGTRRRAVGPGALVAALALGSAAAIAVVAILLVGHSHPGLGAASRGAGGSSPRGEILDRQGRVLVASERATDIEIDPARLPVPPRAAARPPAADQRVYDAVARALGVTRKASICSVSGRAARLSPIACEVAQAVQRSPGVKITVARNVGARVLALTRRLPGVAQVAVRVTSYPHGDLAAQVLGEVGPITPSELHDPRFRGLAADAVVGQTGLESYYDHYLRDGETLETSLDLALEQSAWASLAASMHVPGGAGAFVAMNPDNGQVYAIGSSPSYDANIFSRPISSAAYRALAKGAAHAPLIDRATDGLYQVGAPFEAITALAALESGEWSPNLTYDDAGQFCLAAGRCYHGEGRVAHGTLDIATALGVSDSVFFDNLGALVNADPATHPRGGALQQWARLLGIGQPTGIDLPFESSGNLPDPRWRVALSQLEMSYERVHHTGCCTIAVPGPWTVADSVNLATGQGGLLATPLQLAVAYAAIANGGEIVRPHVGAAIVSRSGDHVVAAIDPPPRRQVAIDPVDLQVVRRGLRLSTSNPAGNSSSAMAGFPKPVYGDAGIVPSGRRRAAPDWYVGYVPASATSRPILVVVTLENATTRGAAAGVARRIFSRWYYGRG